MIACGAKDPSATLQDDNFGVAHGVRRTDDVIPERNLRTFALHFPPHSNGYVTLEATSPIGRVPARGRNGGQTYTAETYGEELERWIPAAQAIKQAETAYGGNV